MTETILLTGAAGEIGSALRTLLARPGRTLRLLDIAAQKPAGLDESVEVLNGSFTDVELMVEACTGVDAVVHMGGLLAGATWEQYLDVGIHGTYAVLEAARRAGVGRVVYASSHHATGYEPSRAGVIAGDDAYPRPDSFYGVAKVASEGLCCLYHDRHGIESLCVRFGSYRTRPDDRRCLWNWISPGDTARIVEAGLTAPGLGHRVVWGISNNTGRRMSLDSGLAIGYVPADDAQHWAEQILATTDPDDPRTAHDHNVGGQFTAPEFDREARTG